MIIAAAADCTVAVVDCIAADCCQACKIADQDYMVAADRDCKEPAPVQVEGFRSCSLRWSEEPRFLKVHLDLPAGKSQLPAADH